MTPRSALVDRFARAQQAKAAAAEIRNFAVEHAHGDVVHMTDPDGDTVLFGRGSELVKLLTNGALTLHVIEKHVASGGLDVHLARGFLGDGSRRRARVDE